MKQGKVRPNTLKYDGWEKVYENTLSSATTSVTISSLDGDTDEEYILVVSIFNPVNAGVQYLLRFNNDSGSNYIYQRVNGTNTSIGANTSTQNGMDLTYTNTLDSLMFTKCTIHAKSGYLRNVIAENFDAIATSDEAIRLYGQLWNNTSDNLTSLVIVASESNGIGIGSYIALYKKIKKS